MLPTEDPARLRDIALAFLTEAALDHERAERGRIRSIAMARAHGCSWVDIGHNLGISDRAAASLYKRHTATPGGDA